MARASRSSAAPTPGPSPLTRLNTPAGTPAASKISATIAAGGSSGGAGAAVASGMAPIAHASDGGGSTLDRQVTGQRTWDYSTDGVAHYGMVPDWVENLRQIGGEGLVDELAHGSQTYLTT